MVDNKRFSFLFDDEKSEPVNSNSQGVKSESTGPTQPNNKWSLLSDDYMQTADKSAAVKDELSSDVVFKAGEAKYRSEQLNVIKVNGIIETHSESKLEYSVIKYIENGQYKAKISLTDAVISIHPVYLQDSLNLVDKVDRIKCDAILIINNKTGKIDSIENIGQMKAQWLLMKKRIEENTLYVKDPKTKQNIAEFLTTTEKQFTQENILKDFGIRPFFELFFDSYLVTTNFSFGPYKKLYYSQLFDQLPVDFDVTQKVVAESKEGIDILKEAILNRQSPHINDFKRLYDERFKPRVGYRFSEYNYSHTSQVSYNYADNLLEEATMRIIEEVQNNVDLFVDYKLRRIQ